MIPEYVECPKCNVLLGRRHAKHLCDHRKVIDSLKVSIMLATNSLLVIRTGINKLSEVLERITLDTEVGQLIVMMRDSARTAINEAIDDSSMSQNLNDHLIKSLRWTAQVPCTGISCKTGRLCGPCHARTVMEWIDDGQE